MYKMRVRIWGLVAVVLIVFQCILMGKDILVQSDITQVLRNIDGKMVGFDKVAATNKNADILISSYTYDSQAPDEEFYSPIIGLTNFRNLGGFKNMAGFPSSTSRYAGDFSALLDASIDGKTWHEVFKNISHSFKIEVYVDENSEKAIKDFFYISLLDIYDEQVAKERAVMCWEKSTKIASFDNVPTISKGGIIIAPEYANGSYGINAFKVTPKKTTEKAVYAYILGDDKKHLKEVLQHEWFMDASGLRRTSYKGIRDVAILESFDSAAQIVEVDVDWDNVHVELNDAKDNTTKTIQEESTINSAIDVGLNYSYQDTLGNVSENVETATEEIDAELVASPMLGACLFILFMLSKGNSIFSKRR